MKSSFNNRNALIDQLNSDYKKEEYLDQEIERKII